jgi:peptidoglycan/LPS O-acetylase OafA/YrhL
VPALDGLRGVAAVAVVFNHLALTFAEVAGADAGRLSMWSIMDHWGHNAVLLFFCLSGFVLQRTFDIGRTQTYFRYLLKRVFRLMPTFIVVLISVIVTMILVRPSGVEATTAVLNNPLSSDLSLKIIIRHLLLIGILPADVGLNPPMWSLVYEWRFSVIFPLMAALCAPRPRAFMIAMLICYAVSIALCSAMGLGWPYIYGFGIPGSAFVTLQYLAFFGFGMAFSSWDLRAEPFRMERSLELIIVICTLMIFSLVRNQFVVAMSAIILIAAILYGGSTRATLERAWAQWLGQISYPLYLCHLPVLYFTLYLLKPSIGTLPAIGLGLVLAIVTAILLHKLVEVPANRLGRRIAALPARRQVPR